MIFKRSLAVFSSAIFLSSVAYAAPAKNMVIAPTCLIKSAAAPFHTLAAQNGFQLLEIDDTGMRQLVTAKHRNRTTCGGFMNVSREWSEQSTRTKQDATHFLASQLASNPTERTIAKTDYKIQYQAETEALLKTINPQNMWDNLTVLSSFDDRDAQTESGVNAALWIKNKIETIAKETGHDDVTVYLVKTGRYNQPSVVAKLGNSDAAGIVVGGHLDGVSCLSTMCGSKDRGAKFPAADDDGSGSVGVLETARTLLASGIQFKKPIYFIWYAAEEEGLFGSSYVVADFKKKKIPVDAVIQLDMTGYAYKNQKTIWLMTDYVSKDLTNYLKTLIETYVKVPVKTSRCGYGCSDHASWFKGGFNASFPFEAEMGHDDPDNHSTEDKMEHLSLAHMTNYTKLATAFAVELAEPTTK